MTKKMTPRERVYAALNHEEADRVPIDFGGNFNTTVSVIAYMRLKKHLGIDSPTYSRDFGPMLASVDLDKGLEVMKIMNGDVIEFPGQMWVNWKNGLPDGYFGQVREFELKDGATCLIPTYPPVVKNEDGTQDMIFGNKAVYRMPKDGYYFDRIYHPLEHVTTMEEMEEIIPKWSSRGYHGAFAEGYLKLLEHYAKLIHEETDYFVLANLPAILSIWQVNHEFFGYQNFFIIMGSQPEMMHRWMDFTTTQNEKRLEQYLNACGKYINGIIIADDFGTQRALQMSPVMFRDQVKPYLARLCKLIHEKAPDVKVFLHCCGAVKPIIGDFIEAGVDALNPVQLSAEGMDPAVLKEEFGKDIAFWGGGISSQQTLFKGTEEDCKEEVKRNMEIFMKDGGFVFASDHDIQEHVSPEKIVATFQTALEFGKY